MRKETKKKVATALVSGGSMTARDLANLTGFSYNTIRTALGELGAESDDSFPAYWKLDGEGVVDNAMSKEPSIAKTDKQMSIDFEEHEKWVEKWNKSIPNLEKVIGKLALYPVDKPKVLIEQLRKVVTPMASLAYALDQVKDSPDWYTRLGGKIEDDQVS